MSRFRLLAPGQLTFRFILFAAAGIAGYSQQTITVSQTTLAFAGQLGASAPPAQTVQVSSTGNGLSYPATAATSSGGSWLYAYAQNNYYYTPSTLNVSVDPSVITATGTYSGTVTVKAAGNNPITVNVTFTVSGNSLSVSQTTLAFAGQLGASAPPAQTVQVSSTGNGLSYTATAATSSGGSWLYAYAQNNYYYTPSTLNVSVDPSVITATGTYSGTVTVKAAGNNPITVNVTFTVSGNSLSVSQTTLAFAGQLGASAPPAQTVGVSSTGNGLSYTATAATSSGGSWLYAYAQNNYYYTPSTLNISVDPSVITATGTYSGTVTVKAAGNNPITVNVTFTVSGNSLSVSQTTLAFAGQLGASAPPAQTVRVSSTGNGLSYTATAATSSGGNWLYAYAQNNYYYPPSTLNISVDPSVITATGTYSGTVTVKAAGNNP